jgi:hypothetical protein
MYWALLAKRIPGHHPLGVLLHAVHEGDLDLQARLAVHVHDADRDLYHVRV